MDISLDFSPAPPDTQLKMSKKIITANLSFRKKLGMARKKKHVRNIIDGLRGLRGLGGLSGLGGLKRSRTCDNLHALVEAATGSE
jgi:hypothetical protein